MKKENILEKIKTNIAALGWKIFLWGNTMSQEDYWERIYEQEKYYRENL